MNKNQNPNKQTELEKILDKHAEQIIEEIKSKKLKIYYTSIEILDGERLIKIELDRY